MTSPAPAAPDLGLKHLEGLSFEQVLSWLESALRRHEVLPVIVPDESPEEPILRRERSLSDITRQDLRKACHTLVRRYMHAPQGEHEDAYVTSLLHLARGLGIKELDTDLGQLTAQASFLELSTTQISSVLGTLVDLRAPLPLQFWRSMAGTLPASLRALAITGLLGHGVDSAFQALGSLPDDEAVADAVFVILDQHARLLNPAELQKMVHTANQARSSCAPAIAHALTDWVQQYPDTELGTQVAAVSPRAGLDSALAAFFSRMDRTYVPQPTSARLCRRAAA